MALHDSYCVLCRSRCGARYRVDGDRLVGVEPWPEHPTGGGLCAKGRAAPELQMHPQRLRTPLRRTTPRGAPDPGWREVGWDEALDDIAARLRATRDAHGAHAVAFASASPGASGMSDSLEWLERLIHGFGSPNFLTGVELCNWHRDHNHAHTFGTGIGMPDYAQTELVLLWGFNPGNVWLAQAQAMAQARLRGAKLIVIDPARTRHARDADLWLQPRPGTDAALALGQARYEVRECLGEKYDAISGGARFVQCLDERDVHALIRLVHKYIHTWCRDAQVVSKTGVRCEVGHEDGCNRGCRHRVRQRIKPDIDDGP